MTWDPFSFNSDPFYHLRRMQSDMDRMFGMFDRDFSSLTGGNQASQGRLENQSQSQQTHGEDRSLSTTQQGGGSGGQLSTFSRGSQNMFWPAVDVKESDKEICVHAELPGLKKEDVDISIDNGIISISGQRQQEDKQENDKWHRVERQYGQFKRSFRLPEGTKEEEITASVQDGVLKVSIPKHEQPSKQPRKLQIQ